VFQRIAINSTLNFCHRYSLKPQESQRYFMKRILNLLISGLFGAILLTGCASDNQPAAPTAVLQPTPTATALWVAPTPALPGDEVTWQSLQVSMEHAEITDSFVTEFGSERSPAAGQKSLWVHVQLKNIGGSNLKIPAPGHFSVLYASTEYKPTYGHRQGYADYTALGATIFPEQEINAWLRFDIPIAADLKDVWFLFLPESSQVGVSPSSPQYPWGGEHPTYAWICAP
jgi:hypothetical protein